MQTVDMVELVKYEEGLSGNKWVIEAPNIEMPLKEVLQAVVDGPLPFIQTIGHCVTNGIFTEKQCDSLVLFIEKFTQKNPIEVDDTMSIEELDDTRLKRRDTRPKTVISIIGEYTASAILHKNFAVFSEGIAEGMSEGVASKGRAGKEFVATVSLMQSMARKHNEDYLSYLKMALYHFDRNYPEEAKALISAFIFAIGDELKPEESDDYEIKVLSEPIKL